MSENLPVGPKGSTADNPELPGTLLFENARVRIWESVLAPGETSEWHRHDFDHLLLVTEGAAIRGVHADGHVNEFEIADNTVWYVPEKPGDLEIAINDSPDRTFRELILEFKEPSSAPTERASFRFYQGDSA